MNVVLNIKAPKTVLHQQTMLVYWYSQLLSWHVVSQKWASSQVPLTSLTSSKVNFNDIYPINRPFIKLRKSLELRYKYFSTVLTSISLFHFIFILLYQIIMQDKKPIAFYSQKLIASQKQNQTIERYRESTSTI
jgi:hypothetical protein